MLALLPGRLSAVVLAVLVVEKVRGFGCWFWFDDGSGCWALGMDGEIGEMEVLVVSGCDWFGSPTV